MHAADATVRPGPGRSTRAEAVASRLRREITEGELPAGSKLSEPSLAVRQGVSRAPVREALRQLEREGLVVFDRVGRSRVVAMTASDFEDISLIRVALESAAATEVALRFTQPLRAALEANIESMRTATCLADVTRLDLEFHASVMESSGRRPLIAAWRSIRSQLALWLSTLHRTRESIAADVLAQTIAAHRSLIETLASGDAGRSAEAFADHAGGLVRWVADVGGRLP
jgi:DNA-binding GntR family transcriptional regulator